MKKAYSFNFKVARAPGAAGAGRAVRALARAGVEAALRGGTLIMEGIAVPLEAPVAVGAKVVPGSHREVALARALLVMQSLGYEASPRGVRWGALQAACKELQVMGFECDLEGVAPTRTDKEVI